MKMLIETNEIELRQLADIYLSLTRKTHAQAAEHFLMTIDTFRNYLRGKKTLTDDVMRKKLEKGISDFFGNE